MSMVITRSPLLQIEMNGAGTSKRRSARLSQEVFGENGEQSGGNAGGGGGGGVGAAVATKTHDGATPAVTAAAANGGPGAGSGRGRKRKPDYTEDDDGFSFERKTRSKKGGAASTAAAAHAPAAVLTAEAAPPSKQQSRPKAKAEANTEEQRPPSKQKSRSKAKAEADTTEQQPPQSPQKKARRQLPTTPEHKAAEKSARRSKRKSAEYEPRTTASPHRPAHARSHAVTDGRSPSPSGARPVTVEKRRKAAGDDDRVEEEKVMRIALPFADTPVIRRNREMRKASSEKGNGRRSSGSLRGRRASSLIDEGRGNALPHSEVPTSELYKHIAEELTEPRRMRCLLGWCGSRALSPKPDPPPETTSESDTETRATQAARAIQEELSQDLITNGLLSDWFSRDEQTPLVRRKKKPNPRNIANLAKAEELERELENLRKERTAWTDLIKTSEQQVKFDDTTDSNEGDGSASPLHPELLDSPQRALLEKFEGQQTSDSAEPPRVDPEYIQSRLKTALNDLEFSIDSFAAGIHQLTTTAGVADKLAERTLESAAGTIEQREASRRAAGSRAAGVLESLRGLARVLNQQPGSSNSSRGPRRR
ncbi:hypothetical protein K431DRAFT_168103 [Polychaeton citri CBS 116435]|uniref:Mis12-Mtw1 family protein n=1 Tax=Polychaeton citri CBS 116435 TaxID=1314669 RepID=A0A9P4UK08_9PEZI|nr:hypothetical protein K431DRAFT_168103 [Polychaeton citri CBS 116435]